MSEDVLGAEGAPPAKDRSRLYSRLSRAVVSIGVLFYLVHYAGGRSLWLDEAMLALNIKYLTPAELAGKLDYDQLAPIGWLFLERGALSLTGSLEYGLRLVSLVAGIGALVLFRAVAFKVLTPFAALAAIAVLTFNGAMVRYAAEAKPYMLDVFLCVAAIAMAVTIIKAPRVRLVTPSLFALVGVAAVLTSFSAAYVLAAAGGAVFLTLALRRQWAAAGAMAVIAAGWLALFAFLMTKVYLPQLGGSDLTEGGASNFFGRTSYAPLPPTSADEVIWYVTWVENFLSFVFRREAIFPAAVLIAGGLYILARRNWQLAVMAFAPIALGILGSGLQLYPMFERLTLFTLPGIALAIGAGVGLLVTLSRGNIAVPAIMVALVAAGSGPFIVGNLFKVHPPFSQHEVRPAFEYLKANIKPGETVFVGNGAVPAWAIYRAVYGLQDAPWIEGTAPEVSWTCMIQDLLLTAGPGRHWVLYTSNHDGEPGPFIGDVGPLLGEKGLDAEFNLRATATQAWLYQVDLAPAPEGVMGPVEHDPCDSDKLNNNFELPARMKARLEGR